MVNQLAKFLMLAAALGVAGVSTTGFAADKAPGCKEQAKQAGIKDKAEHKKFMKECEAKHKSANKEQKKDQGKS